MGDFAAAATAPNKVKTRLIREVMDLAEYDLLALGEMELAYGYDFFRELMKDSKMRVLAANLFHGPDKDRIGEPYYIARMEGVKIGFMNAFFFSDPPRKKEIFDAQGYTTEDPLEMTKKLLPKLRKKCDVVILLAHGSWQQLSTFLKKVKEDKELPKFDLVVAGHGGAVDRKPRIVYDMKLVRPGSRGQYLSKAVMVISPEGEIKSLETGVIPVKTTLPQDSVVVKMVKEATERYNELRRSEVVARTDQHIAKKVTDKYLGRETCKRCHEDVYRAWSETPHAQAFETLVEKGNQYDSDCLDCHTTGYGQPTGYIAPPKPSEAKDSKSGNGGNGGSVSPPGRSPSGPDLTDVQCEACHGRGTFHKRDGGEFRKVTKAECKKCHTKEQSPDFDYKELLPYVSCEKLVEDRR